MLRLFGSPDSITTFVRNQRGQLAPAFDDDFLILPHYRSPTAPLLPSDPAAGIRLSGMRVILEVIMLSSHTEGEQPRFCLEGTWESCGKRGLDTQEDQLKKGWSSSNPPPQWFSLYNETQDAPSVRLGRLTTNFTPGTLTSASAPPVQPKIPANNIPTLLGRYEDYWLNVA